MDEKIEEKHGKASTRAKNKYAAKAYDRVIFMVKKGRKEEIAARAASLGKSINAYLTDLVNEDMNKAGE